MAGRLPRADDAPHFVPRDCVTLRPGVDYHQNHRADHSCRPPSPFVGIGVLHCSCERIFEHEYGSLEAEAVIAPVRCILCWVPFPERSDICHYRIVVTDDGFGNPRTPPSPSRNLCVTSYATPHSASTVPSPLALSLCRDSCITIRKTPSHRPQHPHPSPSPLVGRGDDSSRRPLRGGWKRGRRAGQRQVLPRFMRSPSA